IVERMRTGTEGMATYWPGIRQDVAKLTAYAPLHLPDQTWSIAITNSKEDVTLSIDQAISEQWINGLVFLSTTIGVAALLIFTITRNNQHQIKMLEVQQEKQQEKLQSETESERHLSIAQMITGVTHDLNTPLGIVNHAASILVETLAPKSIPALAKDESAQAILTEVMEVSTLIQKNIAQAVRLLQSFKHHTVRQVAVRKEQVDLLQLIEEEVVGLYRLKARGSQLDLEVVDKLGDLDRRWEGYPGYFSQILLNLLTNIDRYAYPEGQGGKVKIIVSRDDSEGVESSFSVVVQDFGCGIPPSDLPKVFELFYTTGRDKGGTGLGLAMVYKLVTSSLQGTVRIESAAGEGTRVLISLPQTIKGTSEAEGQNEELVSQNAISG
ncbi:MAG: HAMP domain-containing sensor histidine kinase, partial [Candidatus Tectomicrobia bacterium]